MDDFVEVWKKERTASRSIVVKALCYKMEDHGFETQRDELIFSMYLILLALIE
jgi:hypothetical protein